MLSDRGRIGALCVLLLAAVIAMAETDRLVAGSLGDGGRSRTLAQTIGPLALRYTDAWQVWASVPGLGGAKVGWWILGQVVLDAGFVACYALLLWRLFAGVNRVRFAVLLLVTAEVAEAIALSIGAAWLVGGALGDAPGDAGPPWVAGVEGGVASVKWVLVLLVVVLTVASPTVRQRIWRATVLMARALYTQRLSAVIVLFLGVLSLVPLANIWDQLPDVERSWTDRLVIADGHFWTAVGSSFLVAAGLLILGRARTELAWQLQVQRTVPSAPAAVTWWLIGPAAAIVGATLLGWGAGFVDGQVLVIFVAVPVALVAGSLLLRALRVPLWVRHPPARRNVRLAVYVWRMGDALALLLLAVAGLGLVRSFTAPAMLWLVSDPGVTPAAGAQSLVLAIAGAVFAALAIWGGERVLVRLDRALDDQAARASAAPSAPRSTASGSTASGSTASRSTAPRPTASRSTASRAASAGSRLLDPRRTSPLAEPGLRWVAWVLVGIGAAAILALLLFPLRTSQLLGVVATVILSIGSWTLIIGTIIVELQRRRPLEVFRLLHLRASPVLTLLLLVPLVAAQGGGDPDLHALRLPGSQAVPALRGDLTGAFGNWLDRSAVCDTKVPTAAGSATVRPLLLIAAEGGGIRAAAWTAGALAELGKTGRCGDAAAFVSSGVSGGSVGLALARLTGSGAPRAADAVSGPDALSAALAGLFVGDMIAGSTGVRVPALGEGTGRWRDRAGLMETQWEAAAPSLRTRFDGAVEGPTGALVLNSTVAATGCRAVASQVTLPTDTAEKQPGSSQNCRLLSRGLPATLDLLSIYQQTCPQQLSWATAAMLSARFPFITPGGRMPHPAPVSVNGSGPGSASACARAPAVQLVDGGYAEGSGLGTLADLSPTIADLVAEHNASVASAGGGGGAFVVPIVLYLQNKFGSDIATNVSGLSAEVFVPLAGIAGTPLQTDASTWLQRLDDNFSDVCPRAAGSACDDAVRSLRSTTGAVVVAAPYTRPAVDAPLGWSLSEFSRQRLADALGIEARQTKPGPAGYGRFGALLALLR